VSVAVNRPGVVVVRDRTQLLRQSALALAAV
jgi:hypothetical protein